jgi:hypothetical protein
VDPQPGRRTNADRRLERRLVTRGSLVWVLPALLLTCGCFDVHHVDPGTVLLDDFDDGDFYPADPDFDAWLCSSFNDAGNSYSCGSADGLHSTYSLVLNATVVDPYDGVAQDGGALLETKAPWPLDFSSVTEIEFAAKLQFDIDPLSDQASLNLEIGCSTASATDGTIPGDLYVEAAIPYQPDWTPFVAPTADLIDPPWTTTKIKGGPAACLQRADAVRFSVDAALADGQTGSFTLYVDDIRFR